MTPVAHERDISVAVDWHVFMDKRVRTLVVPQLDIGIVVAANDAARGRVLAHHTTLLLEQFGALDAFKAFFREFAQEGSAAIVTGRACPPELREAMRTIVNAQHFNPCYTVDPLQHLAAVYLCPMGDLWIRQYEKRNGKTDDRDVIKFYL